MGVLSARTSAHLRHIVPQKLKVGMGSPVAAVKELWAALWVLRTEPMSSARAARALILWAISAALGMMVF